MAKYFIDLTAEAEKDYNYHIKSGNKKRLKKIDKLLVELAEHPATGTGKVEQLKNEFSGKWSRRITGEHRIVYQINEEEKAVLIYRMKDHYEE